MQFLKLLNCMQVEKPNSVIPKQNNSQVRKKNELIHSYLCEPMFCLLFLGYFIIFINDYSYKMWAYFLHTKSRTLEKFNHFKYLGNNIWEQKRIEFLKLIKAKIHVKRFYQTLPRSKSSEMVYSSLHIILE